jgi:hypothetical protein
MTTKKEEAVKDPFGDDSFGADSEMKPLTMEWGKPGDFIVGTFIRSRHDVDTAYGKNSIYDVLADRGECHRIVKKVIATDASLINKGEVWSVWGRGDIFNGQMNSLKSGQVIKLQYVEDKPSDFGNDAKIIKVFAPKGNDGRPLVNQAWLDAQSVTADENF